MKQLWRRLQWHLHRDTFEREMEEEMRHHLAMKAEAGGSLESAHRQFGNVTLLKEESGAMWNWNFLEQLGQDVRYGVRAMAA